VVNSPRFRRKSSTFVDAIHDLPEKADLAPAQLYSTESGRLFHSGRIVIITVGLPARGKTFVSPAQYGIMNRANSDGSDLDISRLPSRAISDGVFLRVTLALIVLIAE
jgi:hypothetical protein